MKFFYLTSVDCDGIGWSPRAFWSLPGLICISATSRRGSLRWMRRPREISFRCGETRSPRSMDHVRAQTLLLLSPAISDSSATGKFTLFLAVSRRGQTPSNRLQRINQGNLRQNSKPKSPNEANERNEAKQYTGLATDIFKRKPVKLRKWLNSYAESSPISEKQNFNINRSLFTSHYLTFCLNQVKVNQHFHTHITRAISSCCMFFLLHISERVKFWKRFFFDPLPPKPVYLKPNTYLFACR